jgi:UDP-4-amino-4-deoxy-L-arabinose-oxoglutarate aminotransferase
MAHSFSAWAPMSNLQAVLGLSQLKQYPSMLQKRFQLAQEYISALPLSLTAKIVALKDRTMYFRFPLQLTASDDFEVLRAKFGSQGVQVRRGVDELLHRRIGLNDNDFLIGCSLFNKTLSLPIYPALGDKELLTVIRACWNVWGKA